MKVPEIHPRPVEIEQHTPVQVHKPIHYTEKEYIPVVHEEHHGHHDVHHEHHFEGHHDGY